MAENIKKLDLESKDLVAERVAEMRDLFPEVFSEGGIDFEKLRLVLGDEVEDGDERYTFTWPGKRNAIRQSQMRSTATLRPCPEQSVNWDSTQNLYIEGDNLEVLKLLQRAYSGQIKMIYIDPPYNTGKDFVYKDDLTDSIENYKQQTSQTAQANPETAGRFHANWCSMIYPRLRLARDLLTEDGVLVSSIGIQEAENLQRICRELFPTHQVVLVTVQTSGGKPSGGFTLLNEYLVFVVPEGFTPNGIDRLVFLQCLNDYMLAATAAYYCKLHIFPQLSRISFAIISAAAGRSFHSACSMTRFWRISGVSPGWISTAFCRRMRPPSGISFTR